MDLASPLRSIAPGLDSAVLQVLAGTESGLSASQIARLAPRGTRVGQLPVLNRLVEHGLVLADPANQGFLYRLNREHVLAEAVLRIAGARAIVLDRLTHAVTALRPQPVHASVFGSFARGEAGPDSDIDLLIVTQAGAEPSDAWLEQVQGVGDQVLAWTGNRLERVILTTARLREVAAAGEPIVRLWREEAITLCGTPLAALLPVTAQRRPSARARR